MRSAVSLFLISRLKGLGMRCLIYRWKYFLPLEAWSVEAEWMRLCRGGNLVFIYHGTSWSAFYAV